MKSPVGRPPRPVNAGARQAAQPDTKELVALFQAGRHAEVETGARSLLAKHPQSGFLWKVLGTALLIQGKDALQALTQAAALMPQDAESHNNLGTALRGAGRAEEALQSHQRALKLQPRYADGWNNQGIAQLDLGRPADALASFDRALEIDAQHAMAANNRGNALQGLRRFEGAEAAYRRALALAPDYAEAYNNLGKVLREQRRPQEALASYRHALERNPRYAEALANMAALQVELGQADEAIAACRQALALQPQSAEAHCNLGMALQDLGRFDAAEQSLRRALQLDPHLAEAHLNLGRIERLQGHTAGAQASCAEAQRLAPTLVGAILLQADLLVDEGKFDEARAVYERARLLDPQSAESLAGVAHLRKMSTANEADQAWLEAARTLAAQAMPPRDESALRYALGKYFNDTAQYEPAFSEYRRANELARGLGRPYRRDAEERFAERMCQLADSAWIARMQAGANPSPRPVLIVGMPRSGTSLAEQILAAHSQVFGAGELPFWSGTPATQDLAALAGPQGGAVLAQLARDCLAMLDGFSTSAARVVDKMPTNFHYLGPICAALPQARIIHMQRSPLDTSLSIYFQHFAGHPYSNDLDDIAHYYGVYLQLMRHWRAALPAHAMLDVPYESLVDDPESWSRKMIDFIGLPWDERCLDFQNAARSVTTASNWQVRQKIGKSSVERWRHYEAHLGPLMHLL